MGVCVVRGACFGQGQGICTGGIIKIGCCWHMHGCWGHEQGCLLHEQGCLGHKHGCCVHIHGCSGHKHGFCVHKHGCWGHEQVCTAGQVHSWNCGAASENNTTKHMTYNNYLSPACSPILYNLELREEAQSITRKSTCIQHIT